MIINYGVKGDNKHGNNYIGMAVSDYNRNYRKSSLFFLFNFFVVLCLSLMKINAMFSVYR